MAKTLQQIREEFRLLIHQQTASDSDFTDAECNGFANESVQHTSVRCEYPRDICEVQVQEGYPVYNLISDALLLKRAYFGDTSISGDIKKLTIVDENTLAEMYPSWMDENVASRGVPEYLVLLNRSQVLLYPTPDAASGATGKKLKLSYVYVPASMSSDGETPDLPVPFHSLLKFRMAELAYYGKLNNPSMAREMANTFEAELAKVLSASVREKESLAFNWQVESPETDSSSGVTV